MFTLAQTRGIVCADGDRQEFRTKNGEQKQGGWKFEGHRWLANNFSKNCPEGKYDLKKWVVENKQIIFLKIQKRVSMFAAQQFTDLTAPRHPSSHCSLKVPLEEKKFHFGSWMAQFNKWAEDAMYIYVFRFFLICLDAYFGNMSLATQTGGS